MTPEQTRAELTADELRRRLDYHPDVGFFTRRIDMGNQYPIGSIAGYRTTQGYILIEISRVKYFAHRLAWLHVHGRWPEDQIDHINGVRDDNRIANLRDIPAKDNQLNQPCHRKGRLVGAKPEKNNTWRASIMVGCKGSRKCRSLGTYPTEQQANAAFLEARRERDGR